MLQNFVSHITTINYRWQPCRVRSVSNGPYPLESMRVIFIRDNMDTK